MAGAKMRQAWICDCPACEELVEISGSDDEEFRCTQCNACLQVCDGCAKVFRSSDLTLTEKLSGDESLCESCVEAEKSAWMDAEIDRMRGK